MAKATYKLPEDFLMKVSRLADKTDEIVPRVLQAGGEVVEKKVRSNLQAVIGSLHNWTPGSIAGTRWRRLALQGVRPAEFSSAGVVAYQLVFSTSAAYRGQ